MFIDGTFRDNGYDIFKDIVSKSPQLKQVLGDIVLIDDNKTTTEEDKNSIDGLIRQQLKDLKGNPHVMHSMEDIEPPA